MGLRGAMNKLLTVSIAAYNVGSTIEYAVDSVLRSKYRDQIEVIVVNDGSTDMTGRICPEMHERYPDIVKVIDKENGGYGSTVNAALKAASGRYFKLLDGDDSYDTGGLDELVAFLMTSDADMVITDYIETWNGSHSRRIAFELPLRKTFTPGIVDCNVGMHAVCYKTSVARNKDKELFENCLYTDTEFTFYPMFNVRSIQYLAIPVYIYKLGERGQSVSRAGRIGHIDDILKIFDAMTEYIKDHEIGDDSRNMILRKLSATYTFYIESLLLCPMSVAVKNRIIEEDKRVKDMERLGYGLYINRKMKIMRKSNYLFYPVYSIFEKLTS